MKKKYLLTSQEKEILYAIENGKAQSVKDVAEEKVFAKTMASENISKRRAINIRIFHGDIQRLKDKAEEEGIPYQTLITSVLHKYVTGKLVSRD